MRKSINSILLLALPTALCLLSTSAPAARIADVTTPSNQRTNTITGLGLVYGLKGTGDGGDFLPAIRMLAAMLGQFDNKVNVVDLKAVKNVALVSLTATIPATGVRAGDQINVYVNSIGSASSLKDGHLFISPMQILAGKDLKPLMGFSTGLVTIDGGTSPTSGVIRGGCTIDKPLPAGEIKGNSFSLYLDTPSASFTMASNIAKIINENDTGEQWAVAVSEKEINVRIPPGEQQYPANFIANIQQMPLPLVPAEARVVINTKSATIVVTGDAEISPVVVSHKGLTITTVEPPARPLPPSRTPTIKTSEWAKLDTNDVGGSKLKDLLGAMDQLKVPVQDQIDIIKELYQSSKLHAKLEVDGITY